MSYTTFPWDIFCIHCLRELDPAQEKKKKKIFSISSKFLVRIVFLFFFFFMNITQALC